MQLLIGAFFFAAGFIFKDYKFLFLISYAIAGYDIILASIENVKNGEVFDENFLMAIASIGAILIGEYPEAAAVILFFKTGEILQERAEEKSRRSITSLMDLRADSANRLIDGKEIKTPAEEISVGDFILIKPGEKIPLDCVVTKGASSVDQSSLTGESALKNVAAGDALLSGAVNISGVLTARATKVLSESTAAKILELVETAVEKKSRAENFITKFARIYTPTVVLSAIFIAFIFPFIFGGAFLMWVRRALVFLVVSCPCALVVSIPLGFFAGLGKAGRAGILIKGASYLEALNNVDAVVFDKTGTLTKGTFKVDKVDSKNGEDILKYAASAEYYSDHPIAAAIKKAYKGEIEIPRRYKELPGLGTSAIVSGKKVLAGSAKLVNGIDNKNNYDTIAYISIDDEYAGSITLSDEIKPDAKAAIESLKSLGIKQFVMITGDNREIASRAAKEIGIDDARAELLPADKVAEFEKIQKGLKGKAAFVGDGINDAPVLARADIGIAMGGLGRDAALEAADAVIMDDKPSKVALAIKIAKRTRAIVSQNIVLSIGIKTLVLTLGVFGLASIWAAVFADVGVAALAILNSSRV
jgi:Cd2+/Zn2+-exporting ATPase